jgi:HD-GYP domain-containing protein (c-di-GMP phosphodiesterase class II)/putative methionine-R-sulfoxide reductase with GAF domain
MMMRRGEAVIERRHPVADILVKLKLLGGAALEMNKISTLGEDSMGVLERILTLAQQALELKRVAILTNEEGSRDLVVRSAIGYGAVIGKVIAAGQGICGTVFLSGRPEVVGDVTKDPRYISGLEGGRTEMAAPLKLDNDIIGVLDAESPEVDAFDEADLEIFSLFAAQAATALNNSRQKALMERRNRRLALLNRAAQAVMTVTDEEELLDRILKLAGEAMELKRVALVLPAGGKGAHLVVRAAIGYGEVLGKLIPQGEGVSGTVFQTGQAEIVDDVTKDPRYVPGVVGGRCEMAVPLRGEGQVIGVLDAESPEVKAFGVEDMQLFQAFANHAATAIRNARFMGELTDRARRMSLLNRAARAVTSSLEVDEVLGRILTLASDALELGRCAILLPAPGGEGLVVKEAIGYGDVIGKLIPRGQGICNTVFASTQSEIVGDVGKDPRYVSGIKGGRSEMAAPLRLDNEVIGVLDAESEKLDAFAEQDLEVFTAFAHQAATALRNARFTESLRKRANRLTLLNRASRAVTSVLELEKILESILEMASDALQFDRCAIVMPDKADEGVLVVRAAKGYEDVIGKKIPLGRGISGTVFETGKPELVADVTLDPRYISGVRGGRSEMAAPMIVEREVIGVLDAESPEVGFFDHEDLEVFESFAAVAATAVRNARLFRAMEDANTVLKANLMEMERLNKELEAYSKQVATARDVLERQVKQLTTLHHAGQAVVSSLDLDTTLERIVQMTQEIVESSSTTIKLIDQETEELRVKVHVGEEKEGVPVAKIDLPLRVGDKTIGMFELASARGYGDEEKRLLETLASQAAIAIENARLFEDTQRTYYDTLRSLAGALEARDAYTRGHSQRVADLSDKLAERLGVEEEERREIYSAALLHDIGKIGVRDEVLLKPGKLSEEEMETIRNHPIFGDAILAPLKFLGKVTGMVKHHHERWDGDGYPDGLEGEEIPLASRIVAVADTYDALTSDRPYRDRRTHEDALEIIRQESGSQFDPSVVTALMEEMAS